MRNIRSKQVSRIVPQCEIEAWNQNSEKIKKRLEKIKKLRNKKNDPKIQSREEKINIADMSSIEDSLVEQIEDLAPIFDVMFDTLRAQEKEWRQRAIRQRARVLEAQRA